MALPVRYYIGNILEEVQEQLEGLCEEQWDDDDEPIDTVYVAHRPSATENHEEFLVASLSKSVFSHGPYQNAALYIDIYVKNGMGGIERTYRLQELLDEITALFPMKSKEKGRWNAANPKLVLSGDDQLGFTAWRVRATLFVNTTDRYFQQFIINS